MTSRALLWLALGAGVPACAAIPSLTFVPDDGSIADGGAAPLSDATTADGISPVGTPESGSDSTSMDSMPADDSAPAPTDAGSACLPDGAPPAARCCANGTPCIGPACAVTWCSQCSCSAGLYCCAKENGAGKVQSTICSNDPTPAKCPPQ